MINIILCGGSGTRLWPLSRQLFPKQFVKLLKEGSLFQDTVKRNIKCDKFMIVTSANQYFIAENQLEDLSIPKNKISFLLEPVGRNTAPAIALAAMKCSPDEIMLITPSDHLIKNMAEYENCIAKAAELAQKNNKLVTFGIHPHYAETGYGYVENGKELSAGCFEVKSFREKPDSETAGKYIASGNFNWNSGMFVFKAGEYLDELKKHSPEIFNKSVEALKNATCYDNITRIDKESMMKIPSDSIDYAVMEKSDKVAVVKADIDWSDLGSFDSIYDIREKDGNGNTLADNYISINSKNNLIMTRDRKVVTLGMEDTIVIDTDDAVLISRRGESQKVKEVVEFLKKGSEHDREIVDTHVTTHRPWGSYTVLLDKGNYKIKKIQVKPGYRLSLQKHMHRSEHWVVVSGTADVQVGDKIQVICPNESTFIKIGEQHRLTNNGKIDLVIIETQVGEYVGEDDIIRLEDDFSRDKF